MAPAPSSFLRRDDPRWSRPEYYWPITTLKRIARYPHENRTWFALGHTVGDPDNPVPLDPSGRFIGVVLLTPSIFPQGAESLKIDDGRTIRFLALYPLLKTELLYAREHGSERLEELFIDAGITEVLDPQRVSVV